MDFGRVLNAALAKAALGGYASSGMHNPHLNAQMSLILQDVILPKMPMALLQQMALPIEIAPQGMGGVLLHFNPEVELSASANSTVNPAGDNLLLIENPNGATPTEQIFNFGTVQARTVETIAKISRVLCVRLRRSPEFQHWPARFPDFGHFAYSRRGDNDVLVEFPTSGAWNGEALFIDVIPQFAFGDITSAIDIPSNTASYITTALAYELASINNPERPELAANLLREMGANTQKASQDMDDFTTPSATPLQKMNRFRNH